MARQATVQPNIDHVQSYWQQNPLLSYELAAPGSPTFFDELDRVKRSDVERFAMKYWEFGAWKNKRVLDVGCGPGWVSVQYAMGGADVSAVDLTEAAVGIAKKHAAYRGVRADIRQGNAEELPFPDNTFDMVFSSGVLHHTPDTQKAFRETYRVLKPGGHAKITLYRLGVLHSPLVFGLTRVTMKILGVKHPGADLGRNASSVEDFVRQYDGADNPIGIAKKDRQWAQDLRNVGYRVDGWESHFFPKRFVPMGNIVPSFVHHALDRVFGTMIYLKLTKPG